MFKLTAILLIPRLPSENTSLHRNHGHYCLRQHPGTSLRPSTSPDHPFQATTTPSDLSSPAPYRWSESGRILADHDVFVWKQRLTTRQTRCGALHDEVFAANRLEMGGESLYSRHRCPIETSQEPPPLWVPANMKNGPKVRKDGMFRYVEFGLILFLLTKSGCSSGFRPAMTCCERLEVGNHNVPAAPSSANW